MVGPMHSWEGKGGGSGSRMAKKEGYESSGTRLERQKRKVCRKELMRDGDDRALQGPSPRTGMRAYAVLMCAPHLPPHQGPNWHLNVNPAKWLACPAWQASRSLLCPHGSLFISNSNPLLQLDWFSLSWAHSFVSSHAENTVGQSRALCRQVAGPEEYEWIPACRLVFSAPFSSPSPSLPPPLPPLPFLFPLFLLVWSADSFYFR